MRLLRSRCCRIGDLAPSGTVDLVGCNVRAGGEVARGIGGFSCVSIPRRHDTRVGVEDDVVCGSHRVSTWTIPRPEAVDSGCCGESSDKQVGARNACASCFGDGSVRRRAGAEPGLTPGVSGGVDVVRDMAAASGVPSSGLRATFTFTGGRLSSAALEMYLSWAPAGSGAMRSVERILCAELPSLSSSSNGLRWRSMNTR